MFLLVSETSEFVLVWTVNRPEFLVLVRFWSGSNCVSPSDGRQRWRVGPSETGQVQAGTQRHGAVQREGGAPQGGLGRQVRTLQNQNQAVTPVPGSGSDPFSLLCGKPEPVKVIYWSGAEWMNRTVSCLGQPWWRYCWAIRTQSLLLW